MVIDDSLTVRKIIEACLRSKGFDVMSVSDGVEAMRWLSRPNARIPDLITLDINLPKMDGYEVTRRLKSKSQFSNTIIIMISRRNGTIDRLKSRLAGAKTYISKPFKAQEIISAVEFYLGVAVEPE